MPGADASQYTAFKKHAAAASTPITDRNSQTVSLVTGINGGMTKFLPSLTLKNTSPNVRIPVRVGVPNIKPVTLLDVTVTTITGKLTYTSGVYTRGGDYTVIKQAIADEYGVSIDQVELNVSPGSITIDYRIGGIPTKDPAPEGLVSALIIIIQKYGGTLLRLSFENNNTECTYSIFAIPTAFGPSIIGTPGVTSAYGYVKIDSLAVNYSTPGIYKYKIPPGYYSMTIILAGGGSAGTPSLLYDGFFGVKYLGVIGSPGGLLIFKVLVDSYVGKELIINIGAGGSGYSFDVSKDLRGNRIAMGSPGRPSSIEIDRKLIAIAKGGNGNYQDVSNPSLYISQNTDVNTYDAPAVNYLNIPMRLESSGLASNGGERGESDASKLNGLPAEPLWWPANNVGNIGTRPRLFYATTTNGGFINKPNNGGNGYFSILFDKIVTNIIEIPPPINDNLNPTDFAYVYMNRGDYTIPVPTNYRRAQIVICGGQGGDGYVGSGTTVSAGQGQRYRISFEMPTKLLGEVLNCRVGAGGLGGRNYTLVNNVKNKLTTITGGGGENTILTSSNGFSMTAGGGKDNICTVTYPQTIPTSAAEPKREPGFLNSVTATVGYTNLKYTVEDGVVNLLSLDFYLNASHDGSATSSGTNNPVIQVFRGDNTLVFSEGSTGSKSMRIGSTKFRIALSGNASNNWGVQAGASKSWEYDIGNVVCNPRRNPNTIYRTAGTSVVRYNRLDTLAVDRNYPIEPLNEGWEPGIDSDKLNLEFGYNGADGECRIIFSEYIPFISNPPIKIVITGNRKSISAKYFNENNIDITSTIDYNGSLWLYSNDPEFGTRLVNTATTTDIYAYGSEFLLTNPSKITYFMYDTRYDVRSNYLDIPMILKFEDFSFSDAVLREFIDYINPIIPDKTTEFTYASGIFLTPVKTSLSFYITLEPIDVYKNIVRNDVSNLIATVSSQTRLLVKNDNGEVVVNTLPGPVINFPLNNGFRYIYTISTGQVIVDRIEYIDITVTVNNINYTRRIISNNIFIDGANYSSSRPTASPIVDNELSYIAPP